MKLSKPLVKAASYRIFATLVTALFVGIEFSVLINVTMIMVSHLHDAIWNKIPSWDNK